MGHLNFSTTQIYMHYKPRADAARRLSAAFGGGMVDADRADVASVSGPASERKA